MRAFADAGPPRVGQARGVTKVAVDVDKRAWHPSLLPGQIVLVSTVDEEGRPNVAAKSWVTLAAFRGPIVAFGCTERHRTFRNAEATGEFVVNVVPEALAPEAWELMRWHGEERIRHSTLALERATRVAPPLVAECTAHLECVLDDVKRYGEEAFVFGRAVAVSIDAECLDGPPAERYARLAPAFFLEEGLYAGLGAVASRHALPVRRLPVRARPARAGS